MTMSQVASEPQAGPMSLSNGCDLAAKHNNMEPMDLSAGPATSDDRMQVDDDVPGQLCRRSTRVSALKAQEKIKLKDDITGQEPGPAEETAESKEESTSGAPPNKKAKIVDGKHLDQMSHTFYIQEQADGTIVEVEEESDISSINSADAAVLKQAYEKIKAKEPSEETLRERNAQLRELEANLRREESDLCLIKKIRTSQLIAQTESKKTAAMNMSNGNGAYKPTMAAGKNGSLANKPSAQITNEAIMILLNLTVEQQKDFIIKANKSNPAVIQQLVQAIAKSQLATQAQIQQLAQSIQAAHNVSKISTTPTVSAGAPKQDIQTSAASLLTKSMAQATPEQRAAQARQAFRIQADKQLQQLITSNKASADLQFIPNPNQADFCALVALDIIVQRILRDKTATADVTEAPYECEECHTDFTPSWKAIGVPGDMHLYCEACVKASQKKKALKDHTVFMRKAFHKVSSQEKEFEKHIADGKLEQFLSQAMAANQQPGTASTSTAQNMSLKTNGTSTPSSATKSSAIPNTSKMSSTPASSMSATKKTPSSSSSVNSMNSMLPKLRTYEDACRFLPTDREAYTTLFELGFFEREPECHYCGKRMRLRWRKDVPEWRCKETKQKDCSCRSLRTNTWFSGLQLSPRVAIILVILICNDYQNNQITRLLKIVQPTALEYRQIVREICVELEKAYPKIGGKRKLVELEEICFEVRKTKSDKPQKVLVLAGSESSRFFAAIVPKIDEKSLLEVLKKHTNPSTTVKISSSFSKKYLFLEKKTANIKISDQLSDRTEEFTKNIKNLTESAGNPGHFLSEAVVRQNEGENFLAAVLNYIRAYRTK